MMKAPFQGFPPELLAQIAQAAFRPPQGGMGGAPGLSAPQQPAGGGMGGLGAGLGALDASFAGMGSGGVSEQNAVGPGGLSGAVAGVNALQPGADGQFAPPPMPTDIGYGQAGQGGGFFDFLTNMFQKR